MTQYFLIRHAEKEYDGTGNPHLTTEGKKRAQYWAQLLGDKNIDRVYCTSLIRTQETAQPLLDKLGLDCLIYNPNDFMLHKFLRETQGLRVLIVGHQDTTPAFANLLTQSKEYYYIEGHNFGNLYTVNIDENGKIIHRLEHFDPFEMFDGEY